MKEVLEKWLNEVRKDIRNNLESEGVNASGATSKSLRVEVNDKGGELLGRKAFNTVEDGREPGAIPYKFTDIIRQWILDKGISYQAKQYIRQSDNFQPKYTPEERGLRALSGAIAYSIKNNGTQLYRLGGVKNIYTNVIEGKLPELKKNIKFELIERLK